MTIGKEVNNRLSKGNFVLANTRVELTPGESLRHIRELQELSQLELAKLTEMPQSTISGIENGRICLGVERAKTLARALRVHPSVILFPGWDVELESAA